MLGRARPMVASLLAVTLCATLPAPRAAAQEAGARELDRPRAAPHRPIDVPWDDTQRGLVAGGLVLVAAGVIGAVSALVLGMLDGTARIFCDPAACPPPRYEDEAIGIGIASAIGIVAGLAQLFAVLFVRRDARARTAALALAPPPAAAPLTLRW